MKEKEKLANFRIINNKMIKRSGKLAESYFQLFCINKLELRIIDRFLGGTDFSHVFYFGSLMRKANFILLSFCVGLFEMEVPTVFNFYE
jgi:hypothetical protein